MKIEEELLLLLLMMAEMRAVVLVVVAFAFFQTDLFIQSFLSISSTRFEYRGYELKAL
jgi:hypothetical protein